MSQGIIDSLKPCIDSVLGIRDSIGAVKASCWIVTRTWSGSVIGEGKATDTLVKICPSPYVVNLDKNVRLVEAGAVEAGDLELRHVSKNQFKSRSDLDLITGKKNIEQFYKVGEELYQILTIMESYLWWNVRLRLLSAQRKVRSAR